MIRALVCVAVIGGVASAAPSAARPPTVVPAVGDVTIGPGPLHVPASVTGWTVFHASTLRNGAREIRIEQSSVGCGAWAGDVRAPDWAPTTVWPSGQAAPDGIALCVQRHDDAWLVTVTTTGTQAPPADTLALLTAVVDAIRPPIVIPDPANPAGLTVRLPVPATPRAGSTSQFDGTDGVAAFRFSLWTQEGACVLTNVLTPDDDLAPPWLPGREDLDDLQLVCGEFSDHAVGLKWPANELPLRAPMLRALAGPALTAYGAATTNDHGALPIASTTVKLDPETGGRWKSHAYRGITELTSLDGDVPFVITVTPNAACPDGEPLTEDRSQGFTPPGLQPIRRATPSADPTSLRLVACLEREHARAVFEIRALSAAAEPPSGQAAVKIRALLVASARAFGVDAEASAVHQAPRVPAHERPAAVASYRTDGAFTGGLLSLEPTNAGLDRGPLIGLDFRASPKYGLGLAADIEGEYGYTSGNEGELRGGLGAGFGVGIVSLQAIAGAAGGSIGNAGAIDFYVQGGALVDLHYAIATAAVLHTFASYGDDQTRYDVRLAIAPGGARGTILGGAQLVQYGEHGGSAYFVYLGFGFTSGHEPAAPE